jgi:CHAT domain-containing protein
VLEVRERTLGPEHPTTLAVKSNLAVQLAELGQFAAAEELVLRVLEIRERTLGDEHSDTLHATSNLASIKGSLGHFKEAAALHRRVLEVRERTLGPEHPTTLAVKSNLAGQLDKLGEFAAADELNRRVLEVRERTLGPEHPSTLTSMNNLAQVLLKAGKLEEAKHLQWQCLDRLERTLGATHPVTLQVIINMVACLTACGDMRLGEDLLRDTLSDLTVQLGRDHTATLKVSSSLASVLSMRGDLIGAEGLHRRIVDTYERNLGEAHPDTLSATTSLALTLVDLGRQKEAEELCRRVVDVSARTLGEEHSDTLRAMENLALALDGMGRHSEAEALLRCVLAVRNRTLGPEHPDTVTANGNLAVCISDRDLAAAEALSRQVLETRTRTLGLDHPATVVAMQNMGFCRHLGGGYCEAEALCSDALTLAAEQRGAMIGIVSRAMKAEERQLSPIAMLLAVLRVRLGHSPDAVLNAIEAGTARAVLDLLESRQTNFRAAARSAVRSGLWTNNERRRYVADLARLADLERRQKQQSEQRASVDNPHRTATAKELESLRRRVRSAENKLLPVANPRTMQEILAALAPGEVLLEYAWDGVGVSLVVVPHAGLGEEPSAHWVSEVNDAATPPETARRERALINTMQSVAALIAAGLAPQPKQAGDAIKALTAIEVDAALAAHLGTTTMADAKRLVSDLRNATDSMAKDPTQKRGVPSMPIGSLRALSRVLIDFALPQTIDSLLSRASRVIVVPSGPLHELPLEVLVELAGFAELKNKPITMLPSGSILALIRSRGKDFHPDGITAVGDPDADLPGTDRGGDPFVSELEALLGQRAEGQGRLPRARTEATLVASYRRCNPLIDTDASPLRLRAEAPGKRVLHIAAHAVLGAMGDPMASAILLSREPGPDGHPGAGRLSVGDLIATWGDRLKGCELAILSCCQTGRGVQVGDSLMALPIGLLHAGVNAVVASLWKVDDLATCLLMTRFHQNLLGDHRTLGEEIDDRGRTAWGKPYRRGEPMPVPQALAEARAWLRELPAKALNDFAKRYPLPRSADEVATDIQIAQARAAETKTPPFAAPAYWAAFVVIGDGNF